MVASSIIVQTEKAKAIQRGPNYVHVYPDPRTDPDAKTARFVGMNMLGEKEHVRAVIVNRGEGTVTMREVSPVKDRLWENVPFGILFPVNKVPEEVEEIPVPKSTPITVSFRARNLNGSIYTVVGKITKRSFARKYNIVEIEPQKGRTYRKVPTKDCVPPNRKPKDPENGKWPLAIPKKIIYPRLQ